MLGFLDKAFIAFSEHPHSIGQEKKKAQVLFWFDRSGYHMLFRERVEGFLGSD